MNLSTSRKDNDSDEVLSSIALDKLNVSSSNLSAELIEEKSIVVDDRRGEVVKNIEELVLNILQNLKNGTLPTLTFFNRRIWKNVSLENMIMKGSGKVNVTLNFDQPQSRRRIALIIHLLSHVHHMNTVGSSSTKREIFYQCLGTLKSLGYSSSQEIVDTAMQDVGALIEFPPRLFGVLPSSRGLVAGQLSLSSVKTVDDNADPDIILDIVSSANECSPIPGEIASLSCNDVVVKSTAQFVLVVEKDAAFQKLLDDGALERLKPCIIITGRGYPDTGTRRLVHLIWKSLDIPVLALVDADPHGIEIMCIYRFGSLSMSKDTEDLVVPAVRWLGIHPTDTALLGLPMSSLSALGHDGISKAKALLKRPYIMSNPLLYKQVEALLKYNCKAEIEALCSLSPTYIIDVYIPGKMASQEAI